jgi:hypothetical protein
MSLERQITNHKRDFHMKSQFSPDLGEPLSLTPCRKQAETIDDRSKSAALIESSVPWWRAGLCTALFSQDIQRISTIDVMIACERVSLWLVMKCDQSLFKSEAGSSAGQLNSAGVISQADNGGARQDYTTLSLCYIFSVIR